MFEQHLLLSEYGMAGVWLYENAPAPEYRAHIAILQGRAEKEAEESKKAKQEASNAQNAG